MGIAMIPALVVGERCDAVRALYKIIRYPQLPGPTEADLEAPAVSFDETSS